MNKLLLPLLLLTACSDPFHNSDTNQAFYRVDFWPPQMFSSRAAWFYTDNPVEDSHKRGWLVMEAPFGNSVDCYFQYADGEGPYYLEGHATIDGRLLIEGVGNFELFQDEDQYRLTSIGPNAWGDFDLYFWDTGPAPTQEPIPFVVWR